eukprot:TRINITY_DN4177_c0_g2_i1.p1 TRINITY_DN4177_c0_g2~~TRINITY_DN4177_c0_g2_i1.p1  ORF type:complete len:195 (+),score=50.54 TRINITY_DN4177_c0_g2_i1:29-586(+)
MQPRTGYHQRLKAQWEQDEIRRARIQQKRRQGLDGHMKELIALREQGAADQIVLLREKIKKEMDELNTKNQFEVQFRRGERNKRRREMMESSRAEANASVEEIRVEERIEAQKERQEALDQLHYKVQAQLKEANSPANRLAREEKLKALESKKEQLERQRQERLKERREFEKLGQKVRLSPNTGL